jgi:peroxiredoxin
MTVAPDHALGPGDAAPNFELPAVSHQGTVSLADYRGKKPVMVGLFRGLHCPFCRRQIASLATTGDKLAQEGVETVVIVNTPLERARQYFQYRPTRMALASDPDVQTHRAFGLAQVLILPDATDARELRWPQTTTVAQLLTTSVNPTGELPKRMNLVEAMEVLNTRDGFELTEADKQTHAAHGTQIDGHFLIDPAGIIRWAHVEAPENPNQLGSLPAADEILAAARAVSR